MAFRIHLLHPRREQEVGALGGQGGGVRRVVAGVGVQVLVGSELGRIDEQGDAGPRRPGPRHPD